MASANRVEIRRAETTLVLNDEEAKFLHSLLRSVAGLGNLRDLTTAISNALYHAGVSYLPYNVFKEATSTSPTLRER